MTNRLYVANLPEGTTEEAVRRHFATCGGVLDVELESEHKKNARGGARVTMTSPAFAAEALARLDRVSFEGNVLRVSDVPISAEKRKETVKVVQQFRERENMAYDLDCAGMPLTVRIFPLDADQWRIEARSTDTPHADVIAATHVSRREALESVLRSWNERETPATSAQSRIVDVTACLRALTDVRAV